MARGQRKSRQQIQQDVKKQLESWNTEFLEAKPADLPELLTKVRNHINTAIKMTKIGAENFSAHSSYSKSFKKLEENIEERVELNALFENLLSTAKEKLDPKKMQLVENYVDYLRNKPSWKAEITEKTNSLREALGEHQGFFTKILNAILSLCGYKPFETKSIATLKGNLKEIGIFAVTAEEETTPPKIDVKGNKK